MLIPTTEEIMPHGEPNHWAKCGFCGWTGPESDLPEDPDGHPCGKDECPECHATNCITCCYPTEECLECPECFEPLDIEGKCHSSECNPIPSR